MMSADSFATSTAESTEMPTSDVLSASASFIPSPRNPTTCLLRCSARIMRSFCIGETRAKMVFRSTSTWSESSDACEISSPVITPFTLRPTTCAIFLFTSSLSPERILTSTPRFISSDSDVCAVCLGGSRNARNPSNVNSLSSATL